MGKGDPSRIFRDENYNAYWRIHWIKKRLDVGEENICEPEDIVVENSYNETPKNEIIFKKQRWSVEKYQRA